MHVSIEGIDTAGKSTQLKRLEQHYPNSIRTKEPGGTLLGEQLRALVLNEKIESRLAEMFIFLADRAEHIEQVIKPNQDKCIISDRSIISGIAYASYLPIEIVTTLNLIATQNMLPSHVVLLELTQEELMKRLSQKKADTIEARGVEYLLEIQERFKQVIELLKLNHIILDASLSIEVLSKNIKEFLNA